MKRKRQRSKTAFPNTYQATHSQVGNTWQILTPSKRLWAVRGNFYTDRIPRTAVCRKITPAAVRPVDADEKTWRAESRESGEEAQERADRCLAEEGTAGMDRRKPPRGAVLK